MLNPVENYYLLLKKKILSWRKKRNNYNDIHNPESVMENETHKLLCDFDIQTDHLISARRTNLITVNTKREFAELCTLLSQRTTV